MPKQPILRPSYLSDAKYFRRLAHAVEHDLAKPEWWRERVRSRVMELVQIFEGADEIQAQEVETGQDQKVEACEKAHKTKEA